MLRAFGLLVAISVALLLWAVRPSESRALTQAESVPAEAPAPSRTATERRWVDRPLPRLPAPVDEADEADPSSSGSGRKEPAHHADLVDPPDFPDETVEPTEPDRPADPDPAQVEAATEAEAEPDYVPTAADEALVTRAVGFLDQFLAAIENNASNCDRMADSLSDLFSSSRDLIADGKAMEDQPARSRWFASQMLAKTTDWAERVMTPLQGCMSNERLRAVMTSFAR